MSRLTIHNSNNDLSPITLTNAKCTFTSPYLSLKSSTIIYDNSSGLNQTIILYKNSTNNIYIKTNEQGFDINSDIESFKVETKEACIPIPTHNFKIIYKNFSNSNNIEVLYDNNIIVKTSNKKLTIDFWGLYAELETHCSYCEITVKSEITISNNKDPITEIIINDIGNITPLTLNNQSLYLENISINTDTIFNNLCAGSKVNSISISKGKEFTQTENDLYINKLNLEPQGKIKFTHNGENYKFSNPISNHNLNNTVEINNLHNFVEIAKNYKMTEDYCQNWSGENDFHFMASFILQNLGCPNIPPSGDAIAYNE